MKKLLVVGCLVGGMLAGEYLMPYRSVRDSLTYHNIPTAQGFPKDPWNYSVQREVEDVNGEQVQTLYLVNDDKGIRKKIDEEGCTCSVKNSIDEFFSDSKDWLEERYEATKEWLSPN